MPNDTNFNRGTHGDSSFMLDGLPSSSEKPLPLGMGHVTTKLLKIKGDWLEVLNDSRYTANKPDYHKEPSDKWKKKILISEHSTIRDLIFKWQWDDIKNWVIVHMVRHKWEKWVPTQRTDRTGLNRDETPQGVLHSMRGEANTQHLIDTARKRLCYNASPETREANVALKLVIHEEEPFIADVLQPNCIYRGGCPELRPCGYWQAFCERHKDKNLLDIQTRYNLANEEFYSQNSLEEKKT